MIGHQQEDIPIPGATLEMAINLVSKIGRGIHRILAVFNLGFYHPTQATALRLVWKAPQPEEAMLWTILLKYEVLPAVFLVSSHMAMARL
jgi:hypothetical protein